MHAKAIDEVPGLVTNASPKGQNTQFTWRLESMTGISKERDDTLSPPLSLSCYKARLLIGHKLNLIMETKSQYQGMHAKEGVNHVKCIKLHPIPQNYS